MRGDDVLALAHAYPVICVYDDEGWNAELPPQSGDIAYADAAFYLVRVHAPKGLTLVTSGSEIQRDEAADQTSLEHQHEDDAAARRARCADGKGADRSFAIISLTSPQVRTPSSTAPCFLSKTPIAGESS